jgi:histidinol dehydrogenase
MVQRLDARSPDFPARYQALIAARGDSLDAAESAVRPILADVRSRGLDGVLEAGARFDGVRLSAKDLAITAAQVNAAVAACPRDLIAALELAAERIFAFHAKQVPADHLETDSAGVTLGWRWTAVDAAGLYTPGGLAAYPSAVLMNALAAKAAGVKRLAMATPPQRALANPAILAAAKIAGVDEVWRVGGAQAIAALAFGAGPIRAVDVITGPGNAYVAAAKRQVFGVVGIDSIAGPSEVFIIADGAAPADWLAADLLAQAEHDEQAQAVLFTADEALAEAVAAAVERLLPQAGASAVASWDRHGAIVLVSSLEEAVGLSNQAAPEHLQLAVADPEPLCRLVRHAGAVFLGVHAPEALGDYVAGPNHVLPTGRAARYASALSPLAFMKRTSLIGAGRQGLAAIGPAAAKLADAEGLPAHALSVRLRLAGDHE